MLKGITHLGNIMLNFKRYFTKLKPKTAKQKLREDLIALEQHHTNNLTWSASLRINCELLALLKAEMLSVSGSDYSSIYINTGFKNVVHLFDWTNSVITCLKNRTPISFEMTNIVYDRKKIRLSDFLLTSKSRRYPVDALYVNLTSELNTILHLFDDVKDPMYADRSSAALLPIWVDVFAIVEMLCALGVADE